MKDALKKVGLFGIGLLALTEEKINEYTKELIDSGELNKKEGKKFVQEVLKEQKRQREDMEAKISLKVHETMKKAESTKNDEISTLKQQIHDLQTKLDSMIDKKESSSSSSPLKWRGSSMDPRAGEDISTVDEIKDKVNTVKDETKSKIEEVKSKVDDLKHRT